MRTRYLRVAAATAATILVVTGCNSSNKSASKTSTVGSPSTGGSAAKGSPVTIGSIGSYSGANASSESGAKLAIEAWAMWTNAHGGLAGHPVHLVVMDDGGDAATAAQDVTELINSDHVVAIAGEASNTDVTWAHLAEAAGVPVVGGLSLDVPFMTNPDFYASGANLVAMEYGMLRIGKTYGPKFGDLYCAEAPQCAGGVPIISTIAESLGMKLPLHEAVSASAPDYTAVCEEAKNSGVEAYTYAVSGSVLVRVAAQCMGLGVTAKIVMTDGSLTPALLTAKGTQNILSSELDAPFYDDSIPATEAYRDALKQYEPSILGTDQDNPIAEYAWVGGQLLSAAVKASGQTSVTASSVKAGLYALPKGDTLGGMAPPLTFTKGKPAYVNCTFEVGITNGKFSEPNGLKATTCAPTVLVQKIAAEL